MGFRLYSAELVRPVFYRNSAATTEKRFMRLLELVQLTALMERTEGSADVSIGLVDGPVATQHPELAGDRVRAIAGTMNASCAQLDSFACRHGTFVAGILSAARSSPAPAICPGCMLLIRPVFAESSARNYGMRSLHPGNSQRPSTTASRRAHASST